MLAGLWTLSSNMVAFSSGGFPVSGTDYVIWRPPLSERKFTSKTIEATITHIKKQIANLELAWLFENCFPNTPDTTVDFEIIWSVMGIR